MSDPKGLKNDVEGALSSLQDVEEVSFRADRAIKELQDSFSTLGAALGRTVSQLKELGFEYELVSSKEEKLSREQKIYNDTIAQMRSGWTAIGTSVGPQFALTLSSIAAGSYAVNQGFKLIDSAANAYFQTLAGFPQLALNVWNAQIDVIEATNNQAAAYAQLQIALQTGNPAQIQAAEAAYNYAQTAKNAAEVNLQNAQVAQKTGPWETWTGVITQAVTTIGLFAIASKGIGGILNLLGGGAADTTAAFGDLTGADAAVYSGMTDIGAVAPEAAGGISLGGIAAGAAAGGALALAAGVGVAAVKIESMGVDMTNFGTIASSVHNNVNQLYGSLKTGNPILDGLLAAVLDAGGGFVMLGNDIFKATSDAGASFGKWLQGLPSQVSSAFSSISKTVSDALSGISSTIANAAGGAGGAAGGALSGLGATISGGLGALGSALGIPGLQEGGVVTGTGLALLHSGEVVIPMTQTGAGPASLNAPITVSINVNTSADLLTLQRNVEQAIWRGLNKKSQVGGGF